MEVLYRDDLNMALTNSKKEQYLTKFQQDGYYLIDAIDTPINNLSRKRRAEKLQENLKNKINEIKVSITKKTPVILIKKNVFELFRTPLSNLNYNIVHNEHIPFPSHWWQAVFKEKFKDALLKGSNSKSRKLRVRNHSDHL
ncbi:MAG: hypothetical protein HZB92_07065 [Euryarchaeota archaeon]|nr:hypothetical protein [Euryarchaeota archaeon]